jgi:hypothetical protein
MTVSALLRFAAVVISVLAALAANASLILMALVPVPKIVPVKTLLPAALVLRLRPAVVVAAANAALTANV